MNIVACVIADPFLFVRFVVYFIVTLCFGFIIIWFESVPGNGGKRHIRLLLLPGFVTWMVLFIATAMKMVGMNEHTMYLFFGAGIYTVVNLVRFTWFS